MQVASLELCKKLYKVSGWRDTDQHWDALKSWPIALPKYELGYLLRKLPSKQGRYSLSLEEIRAGNWICGYLGNGNIARFAYGQGTTPENAAAKLCIELFNQHILQKEEGRS